jgi:hypothetical protein
MKSHAGGVAGTAEAPHIADVIAAARWSSGAGLPLGIMRRSTRSSMRPRVAIVGLSQKLGAVGTLSWARTQPLQPFFANLVIWILRQRPTVVGYCFVATANGLEYVRACIESTGIFRI